MVMSQTRFFWVRSSLFLFAKIPQTKYNALKNKILQLYNTTEFTKLVVLWDMAEQNFAKTKILKVNVVRSLGVDMYANFRYQIVEPIALPWSPHKISISHAAMMVAQFSPQKNAVAQSALKYWKRIINETKKLDQWNESLEWLSEIEDVVLIELDPVITTPNLSGTFNPHGVTYGIY